MKKFIKVLKIILLSLLVCVLAGIVVLYIVNKEMALEIINKVVEYANTPLPIVGVSTVVLCYLFWQIFRHTKYGQVYLNKMKAEFEKEKADLKAQYEKEKLENQAMLVSYQKQNELLLNGMIQICDAIPNVKVKEIGEQLKNNVTTEINSNKELIEKVSYDEIKKLTQEKDEMIKEIVDKVKKEMVDRYGE